MHTPVEHWASVNWTWKCVILKNFSSDKKFSPDDPELLGTSPLDSPPDSPESCKRLYG